MFHSATPFPFRSMMASFLTVASLLCAAPALAEEPKDEPEQSQHLKDINKLTILGAPQPVKQFTFLDEDGNRLQPSDFYGKPILINLWATWCSPCVREMPSFNKIQKEVGDAFTILPIALDAHPQETVVPFYKKNKLSELPILTDTVQNSIRTLGLGGLPHTLIIGSDGMLHGYVKGTINWDDPVVTEKITDALARAKPEEGHHGHAH